MDVDNGQAEDQADDHEKALEELENIEKKTKKIFDDDSETNKRSLATDSSSEPTSKKAKLDDSSDNITENGVDQRKLKKLLKKMTRKDLEEMIESKMIEIMANRSEIGQLRQKVDSFQAKIDKWQQKAQALSKQNMDLGTVMKKYITDSKNRPKDRVTPVKITRSVGLQVMTADQRKLQLQKQQMQQLAGARIATKSPAAAVAAKPAVTPVRVTPAKNVVVRPVTNGVIRQTLNKISPGATITRLPAAAQNVVVRKVTPQPKTSPVAIARKPVATKPPIKTPNKNVIDVVDLSDEEDSTPQKAVARLGQVAQRPRPLPARPGVNGYQRTHTHPAPLPPQPMRQPSMTGWKNIPAKPTLKISRKGNGIVLSWNMTFTVNIHAVIKTYQLYAYQETRGQLPDSSLWKKVGDVEAMPLPMACTLTQFMAGNRYHFAVRAVDCHNRLGPFSDPSNITLNK